MRRRSCTRCRQPMARTDPGTVCPRCRVGWIYFVEADGAGAVKVGYCWNALGVRSRIATMQTANHCELRAIGGREGSIDDEADLHRLLEPWRIHREWFRLDDDVSQILAAFAMGDNLDAWRTFDDLEIA